MSVYHDPRIVFATLGVLATWAPRNGGAQQSASVILDAPDAINSISGFEVQSGDVVMSFASVDFVGLSPDEIVNVNGVSYRVAAWPRAMGDGAIKQVGLLAYGR